MKKTTVQKRTHQNTFPSDRYVTNQALKGITKITPFFHRMKLSSNLFYEDINNIFPGAIKQPGNSRDIASAQTGKMYGNVAWLWLPSKGGAARQRISINYNPTKPYYPKSQFNITNPTVETLAFLNAKTAKRSGRPTLKIASVEYTIDFHCKDSTDVGNLFYVFRRNYYCPHAKKTHLKGGYFNGYSHKQNYTLDRDTNAVFFLDFSSKHTIMPSKRIKFYERGADKDKLPHEQFWSHDNCDRVRYEATVTRLLLRKHKIEYVKDFLTNPNFFELIFPSGKPQGLFQFKQFIDRQYQKYTPPTCDQDYYHKDGGTMSFECFSEEVVHAKAQGLDLSNSLEDFPKLDNLVDQVRDNVRKFENKWIKRGVRAIEKLSIIATGSTVQETEKDSPKKQPEKIRLKDFY